MFHPKTYQEALAKMQLKQSKRKPLKRKSLADKINEGLDKLYSPRKPKKAQGKTLKKKTVSISKLKKQLWNECRRITRKRFNVDGEYYCFTCGNLTEVPHTGHIIASSLCSAEMRYSLDNLRPQCYMCNIHKSGNWVGFYEALGQEYMENLMQINRETKGQSYHTDWYLNKIAEYKNL